MYHGMRVKVLLWVIGNHPASAGSAGEEPVQTKAKGQLVLLVAFPRPLSRCYPLAYLHPLLCLPYADKTRSAQHTICTFPLICRHCAWERQAKVDVQLMTKCNCNLSRCQDVIIAREMTEHVYTNRLHEDFLSGVRSRVNGTPTFFINGVRHDDSDERETLIAAIETAMSF